MPKKPKIKPKTMALTAFTKGGLGSLLHTYTTKLGCELVEAARELGDGTGRWTAVVTAPKPFEL